MTASEMTDNKSVMRNNPIYFFVFSFSCQFTFKGTDGILLFLVRQFTMLTLNLKIGKFYYKSMSLSMINTIAVDR